MGLNRSANVSGGGCCDRGPLWHGFSADQRRQHGRATLGVAFLGAAFALCHRGESGLSAAMLAGGSVQLVGAAIAWAAVR
jgi:hypothetical protein